VWAGHSCPAPLPLMLPLPLTFYCCLAGDVSTLVHDGKGRSNGNGNSNIKNNSGGHSCPPHTVRIG
jgi:hypothetical protein